MEKRQIGSHRITRPIKWLHLGDRHDLQAWKLFSSEQPRFALHFWSDSFWEGMPGGQKRPKLLDVQEGVDILVDSLLYHSEVLSDHPELWGRLLTKSKERSRELRKAFVTASKNPVRTRRFWPRQFEFHPFRLLLPDEAALLPRLFEFFCDAYNTYSGYPEDLWVSPIRMQAESLSHQIEQLVADADELDGISRDSNIDIEVRAAALFMYLLHPTKKLTIDQAQDRIIEVYSAKIGSWYFSAITILVSLLTSDESSTANSIIAKFLDVAREDYIGRKQLDYLLNRWRENSYAPVQNAGVQGNWLSQS
jgi:hypothetical protein